MGSSREDRPEHVHGKVHQICFPGNAKPSLKLCKNHSWAIAPCQSHCPVNRTVNQSMGFHQSEDPWKQMYFCTAFTGVHNAPSPLAHQKGEKESWRTAHADFSPLCSVASLKFLCNYTDFSLQSAAETCGRGFRSSAHQRGPWKIPGWLHC